MRKIWRRLGEDRDRRSKHCNSPNRLQSSVEGLGALKCGTTGVANTPRGRQRGRKSKVRWSNMMTTKRVILSAFKSFTHLVVIIIDLLIYYWLFEYTGSRVRSRVQARAACIKYPFQRPGSRKKSNVRRLNGYRDQQYLAISAGAVPTFLVHDSSARKSKMPHCASNHHPPYFRLISWCISSFFGFKMHSAASHHILLFIIII